MIKVRYSSIDRYRETRVFKTLAGANKFAVKWVGKNPDMGCGYAISDDGVGKIEVWGTTLKELFTGKINNEEFTGAYEVWVTYIDEDRGTGTKAKLRAWATLDDAAGYIEEAELERYYDGVTIVGTTDEAKAKLAEVEAAYRATLFMEGEYAKAAAAQIINDDEIPF